MKRLLNSRILLISVLFLIGACQSDSEGINHDEEVQFEGTTVGFDENFQIVVPEYFQEMFDINPKAELQYGFTDKEKDSSKAGFEDEIYVTVLVFGKSELAPTFADTGRITLNRVNDRTAINLNLILDDFEVTNINPKPSFINGLAAIKNTFSGRLGQYKVFYKMAIYETENDFYQLLTWCMQKHKMKHNNEMDAMIHSFKEI